MSRIVTAGAVLYAKSVQRVSAFYVHCCGLEIVRTGADHVVLRSAAFELVILAIPDAIAATIEIQTPPVRREDTPIKLIFHVDDIDYVRGKAAAFGGQLNPPEREWRNEEQTVCDGHDPEGNVLQFRQLKR